MTTRHKQPPYTCPRCGYETRRKDHMQRHLWPKIRLCATNIADVALTEDIKRKIVNERIYKPPPPPPPQTPAQVINQYNTFNAYIGSLEPLYKLQHLLDYKKIESVDFESRVEATYSKNVKRLENDSFKHGVFMLKPDDFLQIINTLTECIRGSKKELFLEDLNVIYNPKTKRVKVLTNDRWNDMLLETGIKYLIETIASYYLEAYECYLIKKIAQGEARQQMECRRSLEDYYKFIACFDVDPWIRDKTDNEVLGRDDDSEPEDHDVDAYSIVDAHCALYERIKNEITCAYKKEVMRRVVDIVKSNSTTSTQEVDREVMGLIEMDEGFKIRMLNRELLV
jgi:hypothetical protein